ncbi:MAG: hypothetical protein WDN46_07865 [Methylocella sp.]
MSNDKIVDFKREVDRTRSNALKSIGGGGTSEGKEAHVARLEQDFREIKDDLKAMRVDMSTVRGRIETLPTTWQLITLVFGILGGAFLILHFGLPHS